MIDEGFPHDHDHGLGDDTGSASGDEHTVEHPDDVPLVPEAGQGELDAGTEEPWAAEGEPAEPPADLAMIDDGLDDWLAAEESPGPETSHDAASVGALSDGEMDVWLGSALGEPEGGPGDDELIDWVMRHRTGGGEA
jgi:hypothetical protein